MRNGNEGEEYIKAFPKLKKWINECVCCHEKGYNPSMPEKITTFDWWTKDEIFSRLQTRPSLIKKYEKIIKVNN